MWLARLIEISLTLETLNLPLSFHFEADEVAILAWHKFNWMRFSWWQFLFRVSAMLIFDRSSVTFCSLFFNSSISLHKAWFCFRKHTYMACIKENPRGMNWETNLSRTRGGGGILPYMSFIGMCRCEGYGFQAVYSRIGYINQSVWV